MKTIFLLLAAFSLLTLYSCSNDNRQGTEDDNDNAEVNTRQETPVKLIEYLVGDWQMDSSNESQNNAQGGPGERITFTSEARYIVRNGNQKVDSGAYRMNEQLRNLYLESEINGNPREYEVDIKQDVMTLVAKQGGGQHVYRRVGAGSTQPADRIDELPQQ